MGEMLEFFVTYVLEREEEVSGRPKSGRKTSKMLIDEIRNGETDTLEFKRDVPSDRLRLLKTACAFANCNGGRIVVGVENSGLDIRFTVWRRPIQQTVSAQVAPIKVQVAPKPAEVALMLKDKGRTDAIKNAVAVFRCLMEDGGVLVADIENQTRLSNVSVKIARRLLRMYGIIKRVGYNRNGRWVVLGEKGEWARSDEHDTTEIGRL